MDKRRSLLWSITFSYFVVLIPLLAINLGIFSINNAQVREKDLIAIKEGVGQACSDLDGLFLSYKAKRVFLSHEKQFLPNAWTDDAKRIEIVKLLESITNYDVNIDHLFLYHSQHGVWSSYGYSAHTAYLRSILGLTSESIARLSALIPSTDIQTMAIPTEGDNGYVLLHYPMTSLYGNKDVTVNYLISYKKLGQSLRAISPEVTSFVRIVFADGSAAHFARKGKAFVPCKPFDQEAVGEYAAFSQEISSMGAALWVYYDANWVDQEALTSQRLAIVLMVFGILVSTLISFALGMKRRKNLVSLVDIAKGKPVRHKLPYEYSFISDILRDSRSQVTSLSTAMLRQLDTIRRQKVQLVIAGGFSDKQQASEVLESCGLNWDEEYYFVGCMAFDGAEDIYQEVLSAMEHERVCPVMLDDKNGLMWLGDMPRPDEGQEHRMGEALRMKALLEKAGAYNVGIGMSGEYKDIRLISLARQEAEQSLKQGAIRCYESLPKKREVMQLDKALLSAFITSLKEENAKKAQEVFDEMEAAIRSAKCEETNKLIMRTVILQAFLSAMDGNDACSDRLLYEIANIDIQNEAVFSSHVKRLLRKNVTQRDRSFDFEKALHYIQEHYNDPTLSAERVAEISGFHKVNLARSFKSELGKTYIEYLTDIRLENVRKLLITTDLPITEIARQVGYNDRSSLYRKFKASTGMDMSEYREKCQAQQPDREGNGDLEA